jgi:hypothetical protein
VSKALDCAVLGCCSNAGAVVMLSYFSASAGAGAGAGVGVGVFQATRSAMAAQSSP